MKRQLAIVSTLGLILGAPSAHAAIYTVGSANSCTHLTIQAALDTAREHPGLDTIRVTRTLTYNNQALDVRDQDVLIEGAYATCASTAPDNPRVTLTGNGDDSVVRIRGYGNVTLRGLRITGGHQPRYYYGFGGGIQIKDGPHRVNLSNIGIDDNDAGHGGGISVINGYSDDPADVRLVLSNDTAIMNNEAGFSPTGAPVLPPIEGGGIYCSDATVEMVGAGFTTIYNNSADRSGGGIGAIDCELTIAPRGPWGGYNGISGNNAGRDGGGLAIQGSRGAGTRVYTADPDMPVYIGINFAGREGGGIKLEDKARFKAWDLNIEGNVARDEGGGVSVHGAGNTTTFEMRGDLVGAPAGAVECAASKTCNSLKGNRAEDDRGQGRSAAAARVMVGAEASVAGLATSIDLVGTLVADNVGANAFRSRFNCDPFNSLARSSITLNGVVVTGNQLTDSVLLAPDNPYNCINKVTLNSVTIAANTIGGPDVVRSVTNGIGGGLRSFTARRNLIWQPGHRAINVNGLQVGDVEYLLANDLTGIPASTTLISLEPRLIDPDHGNVRPQPASPAVDFATSSADAEADGHARTVDLPWVPNTNRFNAQDLGAFEVQTIGNLIRNGEFDDDTHLWNQLITGASWHTADHAGNENSGSARITDTTTTLRVRGFTQCVNLPGPGTYALNGSGFVSALQWPIDGDRAVLAWALRRDDATCAGTPPIGSGEQDVGRGGWKTFETQNITIAPGDWTPNTTIEVRLELRKGTLVVNDFSGAATFDALRLEPVGAPLATSLGK